MADDQITAGNVAKELGASPAQVKKAIEGPKLAPVAWTGACSDCSREQVKKIKGATRSVAAAGDGRRPRDQSEGSKDFSCSMA